jgi:hypothetical protein
MASAYGQQRKIDIICGMETPAPWPVAKIVPNVFVYTRSRRLSFRLSDLAQIGPKVAELEKKDYLKPGRQVVFIVHGFWNNELFGWQYSVKNALLDADDSTVMIVTWGAGSLVPLYTQAGANTQTVAAVVAELAKAVSKASIFQSDPKSLYLYCIGHSLGAQICGQAGRLAGNFNRVTGLDPAGPGFETCWSQHKVDTRSAVCVDHIHTDGTGKGHVSPLVPYFGTINAWGHVDFYPNGGEDQTGCSVLNNDASCSHMKAIDFFVYSIANKDKCIAKHKCSQNTGMPESCEGHTGQQMGYYSSCYKANQQPASGMFYLTTNAKEPFC